MRGKKLRNMILQSSYDAMAYTCPNGHGSINHPCRINGKPVPEIVCPDRRALIRVTDPGKTVKAPW